MCQCLFATIIVIVNIIFMILGFVLAGVGGLLLFGSNTILSLVQSQLSSLLSFAGKADITDVISKILEILKPISVGILIFGIIAVVLAIIAFIVACNKLKPVIYFYIVCIGIILIVQIAFIVIIYKNEDQIKTPLTITLQDIIVKHFAGFNSTDSYSVMINLFNVMLNCCGAKNGSDFENAKLWKREFSSSFSYQGNTYNVSTRLHYPLSCCKMVDFKPVNMTACIESGLAVNTDGCVASLFTTLQGYLKETYILIAIIGIIMLQVILIVGAIVILKCGDKKVKPV